MIDLANHPYFTEYTDPVSRVKSYFLSKKAAQMQQHFYFCNTSLTFDSKYLWIRCSNAPAMIQSLAVVSLDADPPSIQHYPGAGYSGRGNLPCIIPGTHDVLFAEGACVYRVTAEGTISKFFTLPDEVTLGRAPERVFTHASLSCDGKTLVMDAYIANKTYLCFGDMETGEVRLADKFGDMYNHAQFSFTDPDLLILDQDGWDDASSGEHFIFHNRIWLADRKGSRFEPLLPASYYAHNGWICHDFWSKDGKVCYVDYADGAFECDPESRSVNHVWKRPLCHCHANADRSLWVGDQTPYAWHVRPCQVLFYDRETNKEIDIFSALPRPNLEDNAPYHLDPHPAFSDDGEYIISTVTLLDGDADVAITPVKPLLELCRKYGTTPKTHSET